MNEDRNTSWMTDPGSEDHIIHSGRSLWVGSDGVDIRIQRRPNCNGEYVEFVVFPHTTDIVIKDDIRIPIDHTVVVPVWAASLFACPLHRECVAPLEVIFSGGNRSSVHVKFSAIRDIMIFANGVEEYPVVDIVTVKLDTRKGDSKDSDHRGVTR